MPPRKKHRFTVAALLAYVPLSLAYLAFSGQLAASDWRTASRAPAGLAPDPATTPEAVVQVYSARAVSWRGWFGVHTWIAVKPANATEFTVHEVMGWRLKRTGTALVARNRAADGYWYGNRPELLGDIRGPGVDEIIGRIDQAAANGLQPHHREERSADHARSDRAGLDTEAGHGELDGGEVAECRQRPDARLQVPNLRH